MRIAMYSVLCVLLVVPWAPGALGQSSTPAGGHHHELHADFYQHWQRPDVGGSCCNARPARSGDAEEGDCAPTTAELRGSHWFAWLAPESRWVEIPDDVILRETNPSPENAHLCFAYERVLCFLPPWPDG